MYPLHHLSSPSHNDSTNKKKKNQILTERQLDVKRQTVSTLDIRGSNLYSDDDDVHHKMPANLENDKFPSNRPNFSFYDPVEKYRLRKCKSSNNFFTSNLSPPINDDYRQKNKTNLTRYKLTDSDDVDSGTNSYLHNSSSFQFNPGQQARKTKTMDYKTNFFNFHSKPDSCFNNQLLYSSPIIKVRSKIFDLNCSITMPYRHSIIGTTYNYNPHLTLSSSSGCSTQSSSSSAASTFCYLNNNNNKKAGISSNVTSTYDPYHCSLTSSSLSSTTSYSSLSTVNSHNQHSRSSLKKAAQNFRDFVQCYEQSLLECLSNVEPDDIGETLITNNDYNVDTNNDDQNNRNDDEEEEQGNSHQRSKPSLQKQVKEKNLKNAAINDEDNNDNHHHQDDSVNLNDGLFGNNDDDCKALKKTKQVFEQIEINSLDHNDHLFEHREAATTTRTKNELEQVDHYPSFLLVSSSSSPNINHKREINSPINYHNRHNNHFYHNNIDNRNDSFRRSLRFQLKEVRQLREQYDRRYRCTEAIEKLEKLTNKSRECDREWRVNERMLALIEHKLESLIGSFQIRVDEIEGWARICPRDTYEIEFRHGKQRQMLRVKIGKTLERVWDMGKREVTFRGSLKPMIVCKVREVKSGWRSLAIWSKRYVNIGVTSISMSELLESVTKNCPILLDANPSGSLKLRIVCQWQPNVDLLSSSSSSPKISSKYFDTHCEQQTSTYNDFSDGDTSSKNIDRVQYNEYCTALETTSSLHNKQKENNEYISKNKFGINKDLARSLLTLPTFMVYDNLSNSPKTNSSFPRITPPLNKTEAKIENSKTITIVEDNEDISSIDLSQQIENTLSDPKLLYDQIKSIQNILTILKNSLEDYGGQAVEITLMSQSVSRLLFLYNKLAKEIQNNSTIFEIEENNEESSHKDDQASALIEEAFKFLDDHHCYSAIDHENYESISSDTDNEEEGRIIASFDSNQFETNINEHRTKKKNQSNFNDDLPEPSSQSNCSLTAIELSRWNRVLLLHLSSAFDQLKHIGSWMLKSREQRALSRLQADTFAMEQIYVIVSKIRNKEGQLPKDQPIGRDQRVLELWDFFNRQMSAEKLNCMIYSHNQLSCLIAAMIFHYDLIGNISEPDDEIEDIVNHSGEWFVASLMLRIGDNAIFKNQTELITIFNIRAFFELSLYGNSTKNISKSQMKLRNFFQIALDLNRLIRMKTRKISLYKVEQILFKSFNVNCYWIPTDLTLIIITLLYEYYCNYENKNRPIGGGRSLTTNDVKKTDRLRELSKIISNWLIWLLEEARFEIREHILSGLESFCPLTRRASCYAMLYLFKLMKRIGEKNRQTNLSNQNANSSLYVQMFYGQEMDCLLYLSLEDSDSKVREEARRALKCLGSFGQERLSQLERTKMGFSTGSSSSSTSSNSLSNYCARNKLSVSLLVANRFKHRINQSRSSYIGASMPNLNSIQ